MPDWSCNVLLEAHWILFALLLVLVLAGAAVPTEGFVVAYVGRVSPLEAAEHWWINGRWLFLNKLFVAAIGHSLWVKAASLTNVLAERLVLE